MVKIDPVYVVDFLDMLDTFDKVSIEENSMGEDVTLKHIKISNSGNNCIHTDLIFNNHRIVIQTYKELSRKGDIDVVQGKPELEDAFIDFLENANTIGWSDDQLNKVFVLYCGIWSKWVTAFYWTEKASFIVEFGPNMSTWWSNGKWFTNIIKSEADQIDRIYSFIDAVEDICGE